MAEVGALEMTKNHRCPGLRGLNRSAVLRRVDDRCLLTWTVAGRIPNIDGDEIWGEMMGGIAGV
ncbi:hypothetical protein FRC12_004323 [Ceratobasidium sp. 428]|nr:hypothetical protein FRC12_004323 [Ceratobasidium sp. 428]